MDNTSRLGSKVLRSLLAGGALGALSAAAGCAPEVEESAGTTESASTVQRTPLLPHLPPGIDDFYDGGCVPGRVPGCTLLTYSGRSSTRMAKAAYDAYFAAALPTTLAGFGWTAAPELGELIDVVRLPPLPRGSVEQIKSWIALRPDPPRFTRGDSRTNLEIFRSLAVTSPELLRDRRHEAYEMYNAYDFVPAALTHYQVPTASSDIMATNFVYRIVKQPWRMEHALADCTSDPSIPCIGAVAALSDVDIGRVLDVRFIRWVGTTPMLSARHRVVVVDSGHAVQAQATLGPNENGSPYIPTNVGKAPSLLWRAEIGGALSTLLETGPGASGALLAYAGSNGTGNAAIPAPGACTDLNDGNWKCATGADGNEKTWKCTRLAWTPAAWGCRIPAGVPHEPEL